MNRAESVPSVDAEMVKRSPFSALVDNVRAECERAGVWDETLHRDLPKKWEKHGDFVILPQNAFSLPVWRTLGRDLWRVVAESLQTSRLGRKRRIADDNFRTPHIDLLYGADGWVEHIDNGVRYNYDVTKCMFSIGNISEKMRIADFDCHGEHVVDLFSGIGYFTLPYLIHACAAHVTACDWNSDALEALTKSLAINSVEDRCTVLEGDCRRVAPVGTADRVNLGLLPTSRPYWLCGCKCLKPALGGILHIHDLVSSQKLADKRKDAPRNIVVKKKKKPIAKAVSSPESSVTTLDPVSEDAGKIVNNEHTPVTVDNNSKQDLNGTQNVPSVELIELANGFDDGKWETCIKGPTSGAEIIDKNGNIETVDKAVTDVRSEQCDTCVESVSSSLQAIDLNTLNPDRRTDQNDSNDATVTANGDLDGISNEDQPLKRKVSRSQSILEAFECRILPSPIIDRGFESERWPKLDETWRAFAVDCAATVCKYLNNLHNEEDKVWRVTVVNMVKVKQYAPHIDHVVVDLDCRPVPVESCTY